MQKLLLVRHGQSVMNIEPSVAVLDNGSVPLTDEGRAQAEELSRQLLPFTPELLITSPFLRAIETAAPILRRYPTTKYEIWDDTREFIFLSPASVAGLTRDERRPKSREYWKTNDPDSIDGPGAESFRMLIERADAVLQRLKIRRERNIILVSHEQFLKAFLLIFDGLADMNDMAKTMRRFRRKARPIGNCSIILVCRDFN